VRSRVSALVYYVFDWCSPPLQHDIKSSVTRIAFGSSGLANGCTTSAMICQAWLINVYRVRNK
jgi:hypothetical protein